MGGWQRGPRRRALQHVSSLGLCWEHERLLSNRQKADDAVHPISASAPAARSHSEDCADFSRGAAAVVTEQRGWDCHHPGTLPAGSLAPQVDTSQSLVAPCPFLQDGLSEGVPQGTMFLCSGGRWRAGASRDVGVWGCSP